MPPPASQTIVASGQPRLTVKTVAFDAPWDWLAAGWRDLWHAPGVGLVYGALFAIVAWLIALGLSLLNLESLILVLAGGFLLLGPLMAVGLYDTSRRLEAGQPTSLGAAVTAGAHAKGHLGFLGVVLMFAFLVWVQLAFLLLMLFTGEAGVKPISDFLHDLLFSREGWGLLMAGTLVGAFLAAVVFSISAVSVPLLLEHDVDARTAMMASAESVAKNPMAMLLWAAQIASLMILGIGTLFVGLAIAFPLIGHATWHAYRALIDTKPS